MFLRIFMPENLLERDKERQSEPREEFVAVDNWLRGNKLARWLLKRSKLSPKTFRALLLHAKTEDATFEDIAERLRMQRPGAWKCWKKGKNEVTHSFNTILLAIYAGVIDVETAEFLVDQLADFIGLSRGGEDASEIRDKIEKRMVQMRRRGML